MNLEPFGNNILVKPEEKKQILVADKKSLCEYGTVIAVGSEVKSVKVGDKIGYLVWGVSSLVVEDATYYFVPETSDFLLCVFK